MCPGPKKEAGVIFAFMKCGQRVAPEGFSQEQDRAMEEKYANGKSMQDHSSV